MSSSEEDLLVVEGLALDAPNHGILSGVDLRVRRGEIHSIFGEEAHHRSALLRAIAGQYEDLAGRILVEGRPLFPLSPRRALSMGIEIIDGSAKGFLNLTVAENVLCERTRTWPARRADRKAARQRARRFFEELGQELNLDAPLADLPQGQRKLVEVARSICSSPRLLLLDESAIDALGATLGHAVVEKLYYELALLASGGATILTSSNDVDQLFKFADRVSVMRDGSIGATTDVSSIDKIRLVQLAYSSILSRRDLEKSNFELFYLKRIYEGIMDGMPFPVLVADARRKVIIANRGVEEALGLDRDRIVTLSLAEALGIEPRTLDALETELQRSRAGSSRRIGEVRPGVEAAASPILDVGGSYMGMLLWFVSPDHDLGLARELRIITDRYAEELRVAEFVHEIKNPLGIILNYLGLMRTAPSLDETRGIAACIEHEVERIRRLLERSGEGHRAAALLQGANSASLSRPRVSAVFEEIFELLIPRAAATGVELGIDLDYDPELSFDPDLLRQVALNIMLNGIEAMPEGGRLGVSCSDSSEGGRRFITLDFTDTGIGIPEEHVGKIFEPFFTTKTGDGSRGVGLSICRDIVDELGGRLEVESAPGRGSSFRIRLPLGSEAC
jgi:signal transduction histidine kinase/ABC-type molybdenum transport system ATPase subunit/photorepair protein PhrA